MLESDIIQDVLTFYHFLRIFARLYTVQFAFFPASSQKLYAPYSSGLSGPVNKKRQNLSSDTGSFRACYSRG